MSTPIQLVECPGTMQIKLTLVQSGHHHRSMIDDLFQFHFLYYYRCNLLSDEVNVHKEFSDYI